MWLFLTTRVFKHTLLVFMFPAFALTVAPLVMCIMWNSLLKVAYVYEYMDEAKKSYGRMAIDSLVPGFIVPLEAQP